MVVVAVQCPECSRQAIVKCGPQPNGHQRYRCNNSSCQRRIFLLRYHNTGWEPAVNQQRVERTLNRCLRSCLGLRANNASWRAFAISDPSLLFQEI